MAALLTNGTLRTDVDDTKMKQHDANDEQALARARARRTALIVGAVAVAIYVLAIVETAFGK